MPKRMDIEGNMILRLIKRNGTPRNCPDVYRIGSPNRT